MTLLDELQVMFSDAETPGNAIDRFIDLRRRGVCFDDIARAFAGGSVDVPTAPSSAPTSKQLVPFGKYKGTPIKDVPLDYIVYALKNFDALRDDTRKMFENERDKRGTKNAHKRKPLSAAEPPPEADSEYDPTDRDCPF